jgi:pimeloyl-ACP methyl ester carboxylesterase
MWLTLAAVAASLIALYATFHLLRRHRPKYTHKPILQLNFASTSQVNFAYHQRGRTSDPLVLVVHGFPDTAASFCHLLPSLAALGKLLAAHVVTTACCIRQTISSQLALTPKFASAGYHAVAPYLPGYFPSSLASDDNYSLVRMQLSSAPSLCNPPSILQVAVSRSIVQLIAALGHDHAVIIG